MGGNISERLASKGEFNLLYVELQSEFGLSPITSRALVNRIRQFIDQLRDSGDFQRHFGQVCYTAIERHERAGKPLKYCRKKQVVLTLLGSEDRSVLLDSGTVELRRLRLCRLAGEAYAQDGALSQEDLGLLLGVDVSTIKLQSSHIRQSGLFIPTRGYVADIGSGTSHKTRIISLYFRGKGLNEIAFLTSHAQSSVERYLEDFARVVELCCRALSSVSIERITGLSRAVTRDYIELYEKYNQPDYEQYLGDLRRRFSPLDIEVGS